MNAPANFYTNENATENGKKDTYFGLMCIEDLNMLPFDDPPYETSKLICLFCLLTDIPILCCFEVIED